MSNNQDFIYDTAETPYQYDSPKKKSNLKFASVGIAGFLISAASAHAMVTAFQASSGTDVNAQSADAAQQITQEFSPLVDPQTITPSDSQPQLVEVAAVQAAPAPLAKYDQELGTPQTLVPEFGTLSSATPSGSVGGSSKTNREHEDGDNHEKHEHEHEDSEGDDD